MAPGRGAPSSRGTGPKWAIMGCAPGGPGREAPQPRASSSRGAAAAPPAPPRHVGPGGVATRGRGGVSGSSAAAAARGRAGRRGGRGRGVWGAWPARDGRGLAGAGPSPQLTGRHFVRRSEAERSPELGARGCWGRPRRPPAPHGASATRSPLPPLRPPCLACERLGPAALTRLVQEPRRRPRLGPAPQPRAQAPPPPPWR